jgi:hypothetical protein
VADGTAETVAAVRAAGRTGRARRAGRLRRKARVRRQGPRLRATTMRRRQAAPRGR